MARYDKYDPISGGFRAKLNADLTLTNGSFFGAVSLNTSGRVVVGTAGQSGLVGLVVKNAARGPVSQYGTTPFQGTPNANIAIGALAGDPVDIMTAGEIVEVSGFTAGQKVYAKADGTLTATSAPGLIQVGWMVEATRMVVRVAAGTPAAA